MAAAFARQRAPQETEIASGTVEPGAAARPEDEQARGGLEIQPLDYPSLQSMQEREFDIVILLSREVSGQVPLLPGRPTVVQWVVPDWPEPELDPAARRAAVSALHDALQRQVSELFDQGYFDAIAALRASDALILDSISDGLFVHDRNRRIVLFNRAAETITGRRRQDVIGRDCHEVFGSGFCGAKCVMDAAADGEPDFTEHRGQLQIDTPSGDARMLEARIWPLRSPDGRWVGLVSVFHDVTREVSLVRRMGAEQSFAGIIGRDAQMQDVFSLIRDVADSSVSILIQGESGTGKELVAAAIHNEGPRAGKPFLAVNCGALPEGLLESELFGHVRGSFTGAIRDKKGRFELADGGTLFLDEIGDISAAMQMRLLRVLQEGVIQRVGGETAIHVDVRVISATHRDLQREIAAGRFREDLFYRLNVVPIWLPPLRERLADIPLLVEHLLARFLLEMGRAGQVRVSPEALDALLAHDWPGNVRELQNWLQYALVKCRGTEIRPEHLPPARVHARRADADRAAAPASTRVALTVESVLDALKRAQGNRRDAALALGVGRATLYRFFAAHPEAFDEKENAGGSR
jgi:PAS domain S-box-containing protein